MEFNRKLLNDKSDIPDSPTGSRAVGSGGSCQSLATAGPWVFRVLGEGHATMPGAEGAKRWMKWWWLMVSFHPNRWLWIKTPRDFLHQNDQKVGIHSVPWCKDVPFPSIVAFVIFMTCCVKSDHDFHFHRVLLWGHYTFMQFPHC